MGRCLLVPDEIGVCTRHAFHDKKQLSGQEEPCDAMVSGKSECGVLLYENLGSSKYFSEKERKSLHTGNYIGISVRHLSKVSYKQCNELED